jgi:hypothetical protein
MSSDPGAKLPVQKTRGWRRPKVFDWHPDLEGNGSPDWGTQGPLTRALGALWPFLRDERGPERGALEVSM